MTNAASHKSGAGAGTNTCNVLCTLRGTPFLLCRRRFVAIARLAKGLRCRRSDIGLLSREKRKWLGHCRLLSKGNVAGPSAQSSSASMGLTPSPSIGKLLAIFDRILRARSQPTCPARRRRNTGWSSILQKQKLWPHSPCLARGWSEARFAIGNRRKRESCYESVDHYRGVVGPLLSQCQPRGSRLRGEE
jgi:hypothetical protein